MGENYSKQNVDLTLKAETKVDITSSKSGADAFLKRVGFGLAALCTLGGIAWVINAIAPNGFM